VPGEAQRRYSQTAAHNSLNDLFNELCRA